jgi:hypothetical protein
VNLKWTNRVSIDTGPRSQGADNPDKTWQLTRCGVTVADQQPTTVHLSPTNSGHLAAKVSRGAHTLKLPDLGFDADGAVRPIGAAPLT